MVLELHGIPTWMYTQRVMVVLEELGVPYKLIPVDSKNSEHKSEEYLAKHPFGQVPYMVDDDLVLYESRAISRYVAAKYQMPGKILYPDHHLDMAGWAKVEQAASVEMSDFDPYVYGYARDVIYPPLFQGREPDLIAGARHLENLAKKLDGYERILSKQRYLSGEELSIADLFHLPYGILLPNGESNPLTNGTRPNVARWWSELVSLPSWKTVCATRS